MVDLLSKAREYANIELLARQMVEGFITGLHKSPYHGFSVEFAEHRLYNEGESTRHIDWKVFAKTDRLYTKRYEEETNLRCQILLDNSPTMYFPKNDNNLENGKIRFSILAAACLSYMLQRQRDAIGITTFGDDIEWQSPIKSTPKHIHNLFLQLHKMLEQTPPQKHSAIAHVIHLMADKIHRRSLVVIFSDMLERKQDLDAIFSALKHLKHKHHEVLIFNVQDKKKEYDFLYENRLYEFVDVETNEKIILNPSTIRTEYQNQETQRIYQLKLKSGQFKIDFVEVDIAKGIDQVLLPYLIKRASMK